jgi:betaine-homocysteine S-methyltransferase
MRDATSAHGSGLLDRLAAGPVICAEGYLFEFERRGYLQAGAYVPEVVLEHPELVAQLHREFGMPDRMWWRPSPTTRTAKNCA